MKPRTSQVRTRSGRVATKISLRSSKKSTPEKIQNDKIEKAKKDKQQVADDASFSRKRAGMNKKPENAAVVPKSTTKAEKRKEKKVKEKTIASKEKKLVEPLIETSTVSVNKMPLTRATRSQKRIMESKTGKVENKGQSLKAPTLQTEIQPLCVSLSLLDRSAADEKINDSFGKSAKDSINSDFEFAKPGPSKHVQKSSETSIDDSNLLGRSHQVQVRRSRRLSSVNITSFGTSTPLATKAVSILQQTDTPQPGCSTETSVQKVIDKASKSISKSKIANDEQIITDNKKALQRVEEPLEKNTTIGQRKSQRISNSESSRKQIPKIIKNIIPAKKAAPQELEVVKSVKFETSRKNLRPRRPNKKYEDFKTSASLNPDGDNTDEDEKLPVYLKTVKLHEKHHKDVYVFDSFGSDSESGNEYDKEIIDEMHRINRAEAKREVALLRKRLAAKTQLKSKSKTDGNAKKTVTTKRNKKEMKAQPDKPKKQKETVTVIKRPECQTNLKNVAAKKLIKKPVQILMNVVIPRKVDTQRPESPIHDYMPDMPDEHDAGVESGCNITADIIKDFEEPIANSTAVGFSPPQATSSPWRPHLKYRSGGPHWLQLKKSSLPAFDQELVLNATINEAHQQSMRASTSPPTNEQTVSSGKQIEVSLHGRKVIVSPTPFVDKRLKQTSIKRYIPGLQEKESTKLDCSLFDEHLLLSPVRKDQSVDNHRPALRDRTNVISRVDTPEWDTSDPDFFALTGTENPHTGKPTRFVVPTPPLKAKRLIGFGTRARHVDEVVEKPKTDDGGEASIASVFESPPTSFAQEAQEAADDNEGLVGIFEELPSFTYERKRKRQPRTHYRTPENSEDEDEGGEKRKKRRPKKNEMNAREKKEMEQWAAKFNAMCEEVDQNPAEVEYVRFT